MPDDVGGRPFPDGWEPDDDRGGADEDFASVVFDEDFVQAAEIHEPTAVERLLAAAQARADAEAARAATRGGPLDEDAHDEVYGSGAHARRSAYDDPPDLDGDAYHHGPYGRHGGGLRPYRGAARWHRPVAWLLAVLMGIGMVALAFGAVYRNSSGSRQDPAPPPATTGVDTAPGAAPGTAPQASPDYPRPTVSATPHTG
ncbi:hypothetical protein ACFVWY_07870 [Streptomyces sp. NPDC058195]|uniref:SCO2584 family spore wall biosynthesis protein n=1 Tax=Streptomyces sp. NPDC058195 TaxID=3346375 RepID=UPI0036E98D31